MYNVKEWQFNLYICLQGGVLVDAIRGANPPSLTKHIKEKAALEKKIQAGEGERTPVCSCFIAQ